MARSLAVMFRRQMPEDQYNDIFEGCVRVMSSGQV